MNHRAGPAALLALALLPLAGASSLLPPAWPAPEPQADVVPGALPPPGLKVLDPWVDAQGDKMFGPLEMQGHAIKFDGVQLTPQSGVLHVLGDLGVGNNVVRFNGGGLTGRSGLAFDGKPVCLVDLQHPGCGDVSAVRAGTGLLGGGDRGEVTLSADTGFLQRRVGSSCAEGSSIRAILGDGSVACEPDDGTAFTAGSGISIVANVISAVLGASVDGTEVVDGSITASDVDANSVQRRVTGSCAAGSSIRAIDSSGGVTCETDDAGGSAGPILVSAGSTSATSITSCTGYLSVSITVPSAGKIRVSGSATVRIDHTQGTTDVASVQLSPNSANCADTSNPSERWAGVPSGAPSADTYYFPVAVQQTYSVSGAGTYSYGLMGTMVSGSGGFDRIQEATMDAMFVAG